eukprot:scaffold16580_cov147-Skeletonema_marinoi.AAC.6
MIGLRGASRYLSPEFTDAFKLECEALSYVRDKMGLKNIDLMVPFCRTAEEGKAVIRLLKENGLQHRGRMGSKSGSCVSSHRIICSNDLTQLCLGVDRDSGILAGLFDEDNTAVREAISLAIKGAHRNRNGKEVGICGQAPSDRPHFARFLVDLGIDSISLTPDAVLQALDVVSAAESEHIVQEEISTVITGGKIVGEKKTTNTALKA